MNSLIAKFSKYNFFRHVVYYLGFHVGVWIIQLCLISLAAFFHFLLDHDLGTIENWVFDLGWQIVIFCKVSAFFIIRSFLNITKDPVTSFKNFVQDLWKIPSREVFAISIFKR